MGRRGRGRRVENEGGRRLMLGDSGNEWETECVAWQRGPGGFGARSSGEAKREEGVSGMSFLPEQKTRLEWQLSQRSARLSWVQAESSLGLCGFGCSLD